MAWSTPRHMLAQVDEDWRRKRIKTGLSTGEGLISHVRDAREEQHPVRGEKGRHAGEYETVVVDPGEADKRLLVIEAELATVLARMAREGNSSPWLRWIEHRPSNRAGAAAEVGGFSGVHLDPASPGG